jgi:RNA polymerase sigma-70 factor (ECF subfamily)
MNIRQVERVIYHQFIEKIITEKAEVNEGFIRNAINKSAGKFIQNALADEIEKGKELEKSIKDALDGLNKGFEELEKRIDTNGESVKDPKSKLSAIEKVKEAIKAVQSQAFDTLTMIGSEGEIDFAGFMGSASVAAAANFGILFSPIRSVFITRKAYKYFLGIIKQTIRRNLLVIQLNFDQFENLILQKSFESDEHIRSWLIRVTVNECKKLLRSPWRRVEPLEDYLTAVAFDNPAQSELYRAVMGLPKKYRMAIYLHYYEGYSTQEIGRILRIPRNTVCSHLKRGRELLKKELQEADDNV